MIERHLLEEGRRRLEQTMLPEGGWGYRSTGQMFVEPTALALLATAPTDRSHADGADSFIAKSLRALAACQHPQGFFGAMPGDGEGSWTTATALLALVAHGESKRADAAGEWLARWAVPETAPDEKARAQAKRVLKIDTALRGWACMVGEGFATVEPTATACVALRSWNGRAGLDRIRESLVFLVDRACPEGGWNYGNPYFFDDKLPPITLPTARALVALALCGRAEHRALADQGSAALRRLLGENPSRKAHAWAAIACALRGDVESAEAHARQSVESSDGRGPWGAGPELNALALLALRVAAGDAPSGLGPASR